MPFAVHRNQHRIYVNDSDKLGRDLIAAEGDIDPLGASELWRKALSLCDKWDAILDVGANYGRMTAQIDHLPEGTEVVLFEPNPITVEYLRQTVSELPFRAQVVEAAVGDEVKSSVSLTIDTAWSGTTHVEDNNNFPGAASDSNPDRFQNVNVPLVTLDSLFADRDFRRVAIKIDVEGYEEAVIAGASQLLANAERVAIMMEVQHMSVHALFDISKKIPLFLINRATKELLYFDGKHETELGRAIFSKDVHPYDALLLAGSDVAEFVREAQQKCVSTSQIAAQENQVKEKTQKLQRELEGSVGDVVNLKAENISLAEQLAAMRSQVEYMANSSSWTLTKPLRAVLRRLHP